MPACTTESLNKLLQTDPKENLRACLENSGSLPSSPNSTPPLSTSPVGTLRRSRSASSTSGFFPEHFTIKSDWRSSRENLIPKEESKSVLVQLIGWYPCFLLQALRAAIAIILPEAIIKAIIYLPTLWLTAWLWIFWTCFDFPLTIFKKIITLFCMPSLELMRKKRTVLISGGSSIQALHLARNFYEAGARVIVCEVEGLLSLTRFSTAVSKFYTIPKPNKHHIREYVKALCDIVEKEGVAYYIPVNATSSAFYDAKAKPTLELLGCICFCPDVGELSILDDTSEMFRKCIDNGISTPTHFVIKSKNRLTQLYQEGTFRTNRYIMSSSGTNGLKEKYKLILPRSLSELKVPGEISENKPWLIVEDQPGHHFITCTTVKQSEVVANVTCRVDENKCLIPMNNTEVENWLKHFFSKTNFARPVTGHFTFRFLITKSTNQILPLNCKVGVSLPYICHTNVHPRILWKPCKHFNRQSSGPLVVEQGRYWMHQILLNAVQKPGVNSVTRLIGTVLDKREVLFIYWDPLPYCVYYHIQLPLRNILEFLQGRTFPRTMAAPVH